MSNIFQSPSPRPNLGRNGFDLSQRRIFSCPVGMLLPVWKDWATAGDKYRIDSSTFIRTEAIETSAFMRLKHHLDAFFVPITQIYQFWCEFFYGTQDSMTDFVTTFGGSGATAYSLPTMKIYSNVYPGGSSDPVSFWVTKAASSSTEVNMYFTVDEFGIPKIWNAFRLLDMLEYGAISRTSIYQDGVSTSSYSNEAWFPASLLAYHKIFHSHYMNNKYFKNDSTLYNVDSLHGTTIPDSRARTIMSKIHYRPYRQDYFTAIQPTPQFSSAFANFITIPPGQNQYSIYNASASAVSSDSVNSSTLNNSQSPSYTLTSSGIANSTGVGVNLASTGASNYIGNLRVMFALDRLSRVTASTGSHYADQVLAHLGVKLPEGIKNEAYFLGSHTTDIIISEVVATATTTAEGVGNTIGDIAGKGFTGQTVGKTISFTAPCDGIIMCLSSIEPIADYASASPDDVNRYLYPFDWWRPETDNLGMSPAWNSIAWNNNVGINSAIPTPFGWHPRHMELKVKYDKVHESMFATHRQVWTGFKQSVYGEIPLADFNSEQTLELNKNVLFYICPQYTNNIFAAKVPSYSAPVNAGFDGDVLEFTGGTMGSSTAHWDSNLDPEKIYASDNFLVNMEIRAFKTSAMSPHSLPKYI